MKPQILFTSPCGPYAKLPVRKDPIDFFYYRNTYKQKMFQMRSFQSWHSLHFLAQNIPVSSVVLENPSVKKFQQEVDAGNYGIIAIGFTVLLSRKVLEMAEWVKKQHPEIEIVIGGYGTALLKEPSELSSALRKVTDYVCVGEGVEFMNRLIVQKWHIEKRKELQQDFLPAKSSFFRTRVPLFKQIVVVSGLGCVYGCSFCATSSQFNRRYFPLFQGKELVDCLIAQSRKHPSIQSAIIYDEDFLLHRSRVMQFIDYFQKSELSEKPFFITVFASVKSIAQYSIEELIACGIGTIFIGVESLSAEVLEKEGLTKRKGNIEALFQQLHAHGIHTLGSLIIGWDGQTKAIAEADSARFVALTPTFYQVVSLHAVPGTALWEQMKKENRIAEDYDVGLDGISSFNFEAKDFPRADALKLIEKTYEELVNEGGAWSFRMFENTLNGYSLLKNAEQPLLVKRAAMYKSMIFPLCILAFASIGFFHGKGFRARWRKTMKQFSATFPFLFGISVLTFPLSALFLAVIYAMGTVSYLVSPTGEQPDFVRREYP